MTRNKWTQGALTAIFALYAVNAAADPSPAARQLVQAPAQMESAYVRGIQKELLAHGYRPGPVDGVAGAQTRAAVRAYQRDAGLAADGIADKRLLDHLKFAQPKVYTFGQPVTGHVLDLQRELARRNYYLGPHDGLAGPATLEALSRFQADADLPQDHRIDGILLQKVREAPPEIEADLEARAYEMAPDEPDDLMFDAPEEPMPDAPTVQPDAEQEPEPEEAPAPVMEPDFSST